jgi:SPP1 gp7 family putative phage head morphogenesis protein
VNRDTRKRLRSNPFGGNARTSLFEQEKLGGDQRLWQPGQGLLQDDYAKKSVESFFQNTGFILRPSAGGQESVQDAFLESWVVYVCTTLLGEKVASIPLQVWNGIGKDAQQVSESDPIVRKLLRPTKDVTWSQFAARGIIHRRLSGEDIWFLMDLSGNPKVEPGATQFDIPEQIINCSGQAVEDQRDPATGQILRWRYTGGGGSTVPWFPSSSIVHFCDYDPSDPQRGIGAAEAAMRQIAIAFQAERYQESVMRAGGPGGFLISKGGMGPDHEEATQARMDDARRDPNLVGRLKLLVGDWDVKPNPTVPKDMVALESVKFSARVICSLMRVQSLCIGFDAEGSTYANLDTAWRETWMAIRDYLMGVAEVMNSQVFPRLKGPQSNYRCSFDFSGVPYLNRLDEAKVKLALEIANAGMGISMNDALAALKVEMDPIKGGDRKLINGLKMNAEDFDSEDLTSVYLKPNGDAAAPTDGEKPKPKDEEDAKKGGPRAVRRKIRHPVLTDPQVRSAYHEQWLIRAGVIRHERRLALRVKRWFAEYEKAQIARLRKFAATGTEGLRPNEPLPAKSLPGAVRKISNEEIERWLLLYRKDWEASLAEATAKTIASAFATAADDAARELGVVAIDGTDPKVLEFLSEQEIKLVEGVNSTVAYRVRNQLMDVLQESTNTADLQLAVRDMLPELTDKMRETFATKEARALTIARTETAHASNGARFMQFEEAGVEKTQWITAGDEEVRETHRDVDGDVAVMGREFDNGLRWPSDPEGPASEVINCRCTAVAVDEES